MFKYVSDPLEGEPMPEISRLGLLGMMEDAWRLCQPFTYDLDGYHDAAEIWELSEFVIRQSELAIEDLGKDVDPERANDPYSPLLILLRLRDAEQWSCLPASMHRFKPDAGDEEFWISTFMAMGARALYGIEAAVAAERAGDAVRAIKEVVWSHTAIDFAHRNKAERGQQIRLEKERIDRAAMAGKGNGKRREPLREWVLSQYQRGRWKTAHQASHELVEAAQVKAIELGVEPLSDTRAQQTLYEWLLRAPAK